MLILPVTTLTAAIMGLLLLALSIRVSQLRISARRLDGVGDETAMNIRVRAQANFAEYVPTILVLIALVERGGGARLWLEVAAAVLIVARIIHPIGMTRPAPNVFRAGGAMLTWAVLLWLSVWALMIAVRMFSLT